MTNFLAIIFSKKKEYASCGKLFNNPYITRRKNELFFKFLTFTKAEVRLHLASDEFTAKDFRFDLKETMFNMLGEVT